MVTAQAPLPQLWHGSSIRLESNLVPLLSNGMYHGLWTVSSGKVNPWGAKNRNLHLQNSAGNLQIPASHAGLYCLQLLTNVSEPKNEKSLKSNDSDINWNIGWVLSFLYKSQGTKCWPWFMYRSITKVWRHCVCGVDECSESKQVVRRSSMCFPLLPTSLWKSWMHTVCPLVSPLPTDIIDQCLELSSINSWCGLNSEVTAFA